MNEKKQQNWIDLKKFNAELKILKGNTFRPHRLCLIMDGKEQLINLITDVKNRFPDQDIEQTFRKAGFSLNDTLELTKLISIKNNFDIILGAFDSNKSISLDKLKIIYPNLSSLNLCRSNQKDITDVNSLFEDNTFAWQNFLKKNYINEFNNVYYVNLDKTIFAEKNQFYEGENFDLINPHIFKFLDLLGNNWNDSIKIFPTLESAINAGFDESIINKGSLPFTVPLVFDKDTQSIIGLKDVRNTTDLVFSKPESVVYPLHCASHPLTTAKFFSELKTDLTKFLVNRNEISLELKKNEFNELIKKYTELYNNVSPNIFLGFSWFEIIHDEKIIDFKSSIISALEKIALNQAEMKTFLEKFISYINNSNVITSEDNSDPKILITDAGEKIGGAKKDIYKYKYKIDISEYNSLEKYNLLIKSNIWPKIDFQELRNNDYDIKVVLAFKEIKNSIPSRPYISSINTENDVKYLNYLNAISKIRDTIFTNKTWDEFKLWRKNIFDSLNFAEQSQLGVKCRSLLYPLSNDLENKINLYLQTKENSNEDPWNGLTKKTKKVEDPQNGLTEKVFNKRENETDIVRDKKYLNEVLHYSKREINSPINNSQIENRFNWRNGQNITPQDLIDTFGFRAIEFGNWVSQSERQIFINMAFDSFCDLAEVLNLEKKDISLGNSLAISFGSRGKGGKLAPLATYSPIKNVINLTRFKGAGCIAHEWFHAFDSKLLKDSLSLNNSIVVSSNNSYFSAAIANIDELKDILDLMKYKTFSQTEYIEYSCRKEINKIAFSLKNFIVPNTDNVFKQLLNPKNEEFSLKLRDYLLDFFKKNYTSLKRVGSNNEINFFSDFGLIRAYSHSILEQDPDFISPDKFYQDIKSLTKEYIYSNDREFELNKDNINSNYERCYYNIARYNFNINEIAKTSCTDPKRIRSEYYCDAQFFDILMGKTETNAYWSSLNEMFARAGAAYVNDRLIELGIFNNFLVNGSEKDNFFLKTDSVQKCSLNPEGDERRLINKALEKVINQYKIRLDNIHTNSIYNSISI